MVETTVNAPDDGKLSFDEAFKAATKRSIQSGEEVTIRFAEAARVSLGDTLVVKAGARIAIDGQIENDNTIEFGTNDVIFSGNNGAGYNSTSTEEFGFTMVKVEVGAGLRLIDVAMEDNLHAGAAGRDGKSGNDGIDGLDGGDDGLPGSPGNGGLSVNTWGQDGQTAVGGILNLGTLELDRVNFIDVNAYGGQGGTAGRGGTGGDGGNGNNAPAGPGGPGGSGSGAGGDGGKAAAGVMNLGTLTMKDVYFQSMKVFGGRGGIGGSGANGGDGGNGKFGGFGGNGGFAGRGGDGEDAATTVLNSGQMTVVGGWVNGDNLVWGGSGAAGRGGEGGTGGKGGDGKTDADDGWDGIGRINGPNGQAGTSGEVLGHVEDFAASAVFLDINRSSARELGDVDNRISVEIYRLGDATAAASVALSLTGVTAGALGGSIQDGFFSNRTISFAAEQSLVSLYFFVRNDELEGGDEVYRFSISNPSGTELGGNRFDDLTVENADRVGTSSSDTLIGTKEADALNGASGNDFLQGKAGDDRIEGSFGIDTVSYEDVGRGNNDSGAEINLLMNSATGKKIGTDLVLNVENVIGSRFNDRITGDFNSNNLFGGSGHDTLDGGFNNDSLVGGAGHDLLTGGSSIDRFVLGEGPLAGLAGSSDEITDFVSGEDFIVLVQFGDGAFDALNLGTLGGSMFRSGRAAKDADDHIIFNPATGILSYDPDGKGGTEQVAFVELLGGASVQASDFLVI